MFDTKSPTWWGQNATASYSSGLCKCGCDFLRRVGEASTCFAMCCRMVTDVTHPIVRVPRTRCSGVPSRVHVLLMRKSLKPQKPRHTHTHNCSKQTYGNWHARTSSMVHTQAKCLSLQTCRCCGRTRFALVAITIRGKATTECRRQPFIPPPKPLINFSKLCTSKGHLMPNICGNIGTFPRDSSSGW